MIGIPQFFRSADDDASHPDSKVESYQALVLYYQNR